jgi:hypothetical protein
MKNVIRILVLACLVLMLLDVSHTPIRNLLKNTESETTAVSATDLMLQTMQSEGASADENGTYDLIWEPNRIQGSVHSVAVYGTIVAVGAGYLYDNEIHIFSWNSSISGEAGLKHVWDVGDGVFKSDILSLVFGDTDRDLYVEIIAGCADGQVYVFEQKSIINTDPLFYEFEIVWSSPTGEIGRRVSSVAVDDLDGDGRMEILVGAWSQKVYVYEYTERAGLPNGIDHRHSYSKVWDSGEQIKGLVNAIATGDTDTDGFREIIAGASDDKVYIFENAYTTSSDPACPHADDVYIQVWNSTSKIQTPITAIAVDNNLDMDVYGEIVAVSTGYNAFVLDYNPATRDYVPTKIVRALEPWEEMPQFPIDEYVDLKVWGNNQTDGVFEPGQSKRPYAPAGSIPEPYIYLGLNGTAMAGPPDVRFVYEQPSSIYNVALLNATATKEGRARVLLDFGKDEELTGEGNNFADIFIEGVQVPKHEVTLEGFNIYVSQNATFFAKVSEGLRLYRQELIPGVTKFTISIDIDPTLNKMGWEWFRYMKFETTQEVYVDAVIGGCLYRPASDAVSVSIGQVPALGTRNAIILGTNTGTLKVFYYDGVRWTQTWDSYKPIPLYQKDNATRYRKRFSMGGNIWSISMTASGFGRRFMVVGTNPKVAFIEVNASTLEAVSVWDTGKVLTKWTMSLGLADIDADKEDEVVVGSFDNNIYVFDHVFQNTYRRAWRSPDLEHNETYWDHVTDLTVGDWDGDTKAEIIAGTDSLEYPMIHIFKNIGDNAFSLNETLELPRNGGPITAIELGQDLDADGAKEIVVAAHDTIYIFEKKDGKTTSYSFLIDPVSFCDVYALATGDADKDGFGEIIVGGAKSGKSLTRTFVPYHSFIYVFENYGNATVPRDNNYRLVWSAPVGQMVTEDSVQQPAVYFVALDDQDKDGKNEIIVGHSLGINIYECTGDDTFYLAQIITGSASYPAYQPTQLIALPNNYCPGPMDYDEGAWYDSACVAQYSNGTYVMVYTALDTSIPSTTPSSYNMSRLFYSKSTDGISWTSPRRVTYDGQYNLTRPDGAHYSWLYYERTPSIVITPEDEIWITYEAKFVWSGELPVVDTSLWVYVTKLEPAFPTRYLSRIRDQAISPSIFWNSTSYTLGLTFLNHTDKWYESGLYLCKSHWGYLSSKGQTTQPATAIPPIPPPLIPYPIWEEPQLQHCKIGASTFPALSQEAVYLNDGSLAVVFNAYNASNIAYRLDYDIWFMNTNTSDPSRWNEPRSISMSPNYDEYAPSIAKLKGDVLAVVYRTGDHFGRPPSRICITASMNNGLSWTTPQELPKSPSPQEPYAPSIYGLLNGGFMYTFHASLNAIFPITSPTIYFARNPVENWWRYTLSQVQSLAVGDTDADGINEIVAGSLNQIYVLKLTGSVYRQKWVSQLLPQNITDIAIGDINKDGTDEIVVTADSGNLYAFKWQKNLPA